MSEKSLFKLKKEPFKIKDESKLIQMVRQSLETTEDGKLSVMVYPITPPEIKEAINEGSYNEDELRSFKVCFKPVTFENNTLFHYSSEFKKRVGIDENNKAHRMILVGDSKNFLVGVAVGIYAGFGFYIPFEFYELKYDIFV